MEELVRELREKKILKNPRIIEAFLRIDRQDFIPSDMRGFAYTDTALPIGWNQTISQPFVVAFMLEKLGPKKGSHILDIGAGSGWTTALLSEVVGSTGKVIGIEVVSNLAEFGKSNVATYNFVKNGIVEFLCQDGSRGYEKYSPYDGILVSASLSKKGLPNAWQKQLKIGGKIVVPIKNSIWVFTKIGDKKFDEQEYPGFVFVPFVSPLTP